MTAGFGRTIRSGNNVLSREARRILNRSGSAATVLGPLVNAIDPRILNGGTYAGDANIFSAQFDERTVDLLSDLEFAQQAQVQEARDPKLTEEYDWRARLRPKDGGADRFYGLTGTNNQLDILMRPIIDSNGLVWPNTPNFFLNSSATYQSHLGQGQQYQIHSYHNSNINEITLSGVFTANDVYEARYMLAMMTFLKIATKGHFGDTAVADGTAGAPPPVLVFEYLGDHGFNKVPVVVTNYNITFSDDVDYVPVKLEAGDAVTYVPTLTDVIVVLSPQYNPRKVREKFDLQQIANGEAYKQGFV